MRNKRLATPTVKVGFLFPSRVLHLLGAVMLWGIVLALSACAAPEVATTAPPPTAVPEVETFPLTYTDVLDREVVIEVQPQRIVSLAPSVTEMLFAIGAGSQVVGRTEYCNYPPEAEALPTIGGFDSSSISVETILDLEPDLVIGGSVYQADIAASLEEAGLATIIVEPASLADIEAVMVDLGEITGNEEGAAEVVSDMQARIAAVTEKTDAIPDDERLTVFYEVWHEPLITTSNETYIGELITLAGGVNIFADAEGTYPTVSAEQIIESDPVVIVGPSSHADQLTVEMIASREGWEDLRAVQNEAVYIFDGDMLSRSGPRVVDILEQMAATFYRDLFND